MQFKIVINLHRTACQGHWRKKERKKEEYISAKNLRNFEINFLEKARTFLSLDSSKCF